MEDIAEFLRSTRILSGLSDQLLDRLGAEVIETQVCAGSWIFRAGESADSMFIVRSGRVEVIDEGPPESLIRPLRRGDVLGELALLRDGTRLASARARTDVGLLVLNRVAFVRLIDVAPGFALGLTRTMGAHLAATRAPARVAARPRTLAVIALDLAMPVAEIANSLARALQAQGSVANLSGGNVETLDQAERDADRVVLHAAPDAGTDWVEICLREADLVVAVTGGAPEPRWLETDVLRGCELLALGGSVNEMTVERLSPREVQAVDDRTQRIAAVQALGRRVAGRSLGLVLSGGGARALAHVGVIEELLASGLHVDRVAGVSLGAVVAAAIAAGFSSEAIYEACDRNFVQTNPSRDFVPPAYALLRGTKTRRLLADFFGERRIEELPSRFFCLSCDLVGRDVVVHRTGPLTDALYASLAIPGVFPPMATPDGRLLVDGGVLDNLPVATMAARGEGPVIAVDVTGRIGKIRRGGHPIRTRIARSMQLALTGFELEIPRLAETMIRTIMVGSADTVAAARQHADMVISPDVEGIRLMDWKALPRARELGRRAAREALLAHEQLLSGLGVLDASERS